MKETQPRIPERAKAPSNRQCDAAPKTGSVAIGGSLELTPEELLNYHGLCPARNLHKRLLIESMQQAE